MRGSPASKPPARPRRETVPVVHFPLKAKGLPWKDLVPRRWRRRVVIQGQRFVL